jgi:hypothetical protein
MFMIVTLLRVICGFENRFMLPIDPVVCHRFNQPERSRRAVRLAFLEITFAHAHAIGDMRKAHDRLLLRLGECIKRCRLHLHSQHAFGASELDGLCCFPIGRVGRPRRAAFYRRSGLIQGSGKALAEFREKANVFRWRQIMVAGS